MGRKHGQVLVVFALVLLVLLGYLGLALDGGYSFASSRAVSIAADAAARAAMVDVRRAQGNSSLTSLYGRATSDGLAIGQRNLANAGLTGITITISYNDSATASPTGGGWYSGPPESLTAAART